MITLEVIIQYLRHREDSRSCLELQIHVFKVAGWERFLIGVQHSDVSPDRLPDLHLEDE